MVTIRDVAQEAGVSITTVSAVLRGREKIQRINEQTSRKVRDAASLLGYRPNRTAAALRSRRSGIIGIEMPLNSQFGNALFATILQEKLAERSCQAIFAFHNSLKDGGTALANLISHKIDGLISWHYDKILEAAELPMVFYYTHPHYPQYDSVAPDHAFYCKHVIACARKGRHRRIAYFLHDPIRYRILKDSAERYGIEVESLGHRNILTPEKAMREAEMLFRRKEFPTLFLANDELALGIYAAAEKNALSIPADVSVIGMDNLSFSSFMHPKLSTFRLKMEESAEIMIDLLLRRIEDPSRTSEHLMLPMDFIMRDSVLKHESLPGACNR